MDLLKTKEKDLSAFLNKLIQVQTGATPQIKDASPDCTRAAFGKWIDNCDFPFLIDTLGLGDAVFAHVFPEVQLSLVERKGLANALEAHCESCGHCREKRTADLAWKSRMERVFAENKKIIRKVLARAVGK
jgi:hypothetical protein